MTPTWPLVPGAQAATSGGGAIVIPQLGVIATSAVPPVESVTFTVKEKDPAAFGVPLINPAADIVNPPGKDPEFSANV